MKHSKRKSIPKLSELDINKCMLYKGVSNEAAILFNRDHETPSSNNLLPPKKIDKMKLSVNSHSAIDMALNNRSCDILTKVPSHSRKLAPMSNNSTIDLSHNVLSSSAAGVSTVSLFSPRQCDVGQSDMNVLNRLARSERVQAMVSLDVRDQMLGDERERERGGREIFGRLSDKLLPLPGNEEREREKREQERCIEKVRERKAGKEKERMRDIKNNMYAVPEPYLRPHQLPQLSNSSTSHGLSSNIPIPSHATTRARSHTSTRPW